MESSEHGAHISPTNLYKQADYWQVYIFILLFWDLPKILVLLQHYHFSFLLLSVLLILCIHEFSDHTNQQSKRLKYGNHRNDHAVNLPPPSLPPQCPSLSDIHLYRYIYFVIDTTD